MIDIRNENYYSNKNNSGISKIIKLLDSNNSELLYQNDVEVKYSNGRKILGRKYYFFVNNNTYELIVTDSGRYSAKNIKTNRSIGSGLTQKEFINNISDIFNKNYESDLQKEIDKYFSKEIE